MIPSFMSLLLLASQVAAFPNVARRAETSTNTKDATTTEAPTPWVSIYDDGTASTFTEHVTTNTAGQTTTVDAQPTGTSVNSADGTQDIYAKCDSTKYELTATGNKQPWIPFCAPSNGSEWWYTGNYYVTWNPDYWTRNSSVKIVLNYVNPGGAGRVAKSWETFNSYGSLEVSPSEDWLLNQTALNSGEKTKLSSQPMFFTIVDSSSKSDDNQAGPTVVLTANPTATPADTSPRNRPAPTVLGLAIGLPLVAVFAFGSICCLHFCMRSKRKVGPVSIGGGRRHFSKRGYSGRAERRKKAAMGGQAAYRDEVDDGISPADARSAEWELANVKGGR